jgi:hypothetical protein
MPNTQINQYQTIKNKTIGESVKYFYKTCLLYLQLYRLAREKVVQKTK